MSTSPYGVQGGAMSVPSSAPPRTRPVGAAERLGPAPIAAQPEPAQPAGPKADDLRYSEDGLTVERYVAKSDEWVPFIAAEHADLLRAIGMVETTAEQTLRNGQYADGFRDGMTAAADALRKALGAPR